MHLDSGAGNGGSDTVLAGERNADNLRLALTRHVNNVLLCRSPGGSRRARSSRRLRILLRFLLLRMLRRRPLPQHGLQRHPAPGLLLPQLRLGHACLAPSMVCRSQPPGRMRTPLVAARAPLRGHSC